MKSRLLATLVSLCVIFSVAYSESVDQFVTNKIINIGRVSVIPMATPIQWSPDGSKISFFNKDGFVIVDTLGNVELVHDFSLVPQRYLWLSNDEVCLSLNEGLDKDSSINKLVVFNIKLQESKLISQFTRYRHYHDIANTTSFHGPLESIDGNLYYQFTQYTTNSAKSGTLQEKRWVRPEKSPSLDDDYILKWHNEGLYKVNLNSSDSIQIFPPIDGTHRGGAIMSPNHHAILSRGIYINLIDSMHLDMNSLIRNPLDSTYSCSISFSNFNPRFPEILVDIAFDDAPGDRTVATRIGMFYPEKRELIIMDPPGDQAFCGYPCYAPDGLKVAFVADKNGFIMYRKKERGQ